MGWNRVRKDGAADMDPHEGKLLPSRFGAMRSHFKDRRIIHRILWVGILRQNLYRDERHDGPFEYPKALRASKGN